jgi:hypothetical protein
LTWPARTPRFDESIAHRLLNGQQWSPGHLALAAAGLLLALRALRRPGAAARGWPIPTLAAAAHLGGLALTPAAYAQYYLLALPALCAVAAAAWRPWWRTAPGRAVLLLSAAAAAWHAWRHLREQPFWPLPAPPFRWIAWGDVLLPAAALALGLVALVFAALSRRRPAAACGLAAAVALAAVSVPRTAFMLTHWRNAAAERAAVAALAALPPADGPLQDGFSGLGCLRPAATYWWWVNHHSAPLIAREGGVAEIAAALRQGRAAYVAMDEDFRAFAERYPPVMAALLERYEPFPGQPVPLWRRRGP